MDILISIVFIVLLIFVLIIDIKYLIIPNNIIILVIILSSINFVNKSFDITKIFGLLVGFGLFFILFLLFPKGIGFGDVKLAGAIGLFLGFKLTILAILLSFFSGAIVGLLLIALGKKTMKDPIPFGPFLAFGAIFSIFFGEYIIDWYLKLLV